MAKKSVISGLFSTFRVFMCAEKDTRENIPLSLSLLIASKNLPPGALPHTRRQNSVTREPFVEMGQKQEKSDPSHLYSNLVFSALCTLCNVPSYDIKLRSDITVFPSIKFYNNLESERERSIKPFCHFPNIRQIVRVHSTKKMVPKKRLLK